MIHATFNFPGHTSEEHDIEATPNVGDSVDGPELEGVVWKVSAVFRNSTTGVAEITCKAEAAPQIVGDGCPCPLTS